MTMKRRANGEGNIRERPDGRWSARLDLGWIEVKNQDGSIKRKRHRPEVYGKTKKEVREKLDAMKRDHALGLPVAPQRMTVEDFLGRWLRDKVQPRNKPRTYESYRQVIRLYINPAIGRVQLEKLTPLYVQMLLNKCQAEGLSPRTQQYVRGILRAALNQAVRWGFALRNVAALT